MITLILKILIIDNDDAFRDLLEIYCRKHGMHEIIVAATLSEARTSLASGFAPDIVFADLNLPEGVSTDIFPDIFDANHEASVYLLSGGLGDDGHEMARRFGADYIEKPMRLEVIRDILDIHQR